MVLLCESLRTSADPLRSRRFEGCLTAEGAEDAQRKREDFPLRISAVSLRSRRLNRLLRAAKNLFGHPCGRPVSPGFGKDPHFCDIVRPSGRLTYAS